MPALARPALDPSAADKFRAAGRIAGAARRLAAGLVAPGVRLAEVMEKTEAFIRSQGGGPAFPAQTSRNHIAAHYCPPPGDPTTYQEGDVVKVDIGVEVDGYVADTAQTIYLGSDPRYQRLVAAAKAALEAAIDRARPGARVTELSAAIEQAIEGHGLRPVYNLTGHGLDRWRVHTAPSIPASPDRHGDVELQPGMVIAIEPFATDGRGQVYERGRAEVFMVPRPPAKMKGLDAAAWEVIERMRGLPFARRSFPASIPASAVEATLGRLMRIGCLVSYPPLVDPDPNVRVSQYEHSLLITESGVEVLTADA